MKTLIAFLAFYLLLTATGFSQDFNVPTDYQFNSKEDYAKYENNIIDAAKWLVATPLNEQADKRQAVSAFVVKWINGSPTVNVEINPTIMDFEKKNGGMLVIYMASSARYVLEHSYSTDMREKQKVALRDMMTVYKSGKGVQKDKKMEKLITSDENGKLDEWLADNLKINDRN